MNENNGIKVNEFTIGADTSAISQSEKDFRFKTSYDMQSACMSSRIVHSWKSSTSSTTDVELLKDWCLKNGANWDQVENFLNAPVFGGKMEFENEFRKMAEA